jgi:hemolysin III
MKLAREFVATPHRCPGQISWDYDRTEIMADGAVHVIGVCLGFIGAVAIVVMAVTIERINVTPILVYVIGLVTMLAFSAAYNMWPVSPIKWVLRRFDHSAIYLLIAATYTPFLGQMKNALAAGLGIWHGFGLARGKLPLCGRPRLLALGISGASHLDRKHTSRHYLPTPRGGARRVVDSSRRVVE